jgi:hypothetical protein
MKVGKQTQTTPSIIHLPKHHKKTKHNKTQLPPTHHPQITLYPPKNPPKHHLNNTHLPFNNTSNRTIPDRGTHPKMAKPFFPVPTGFRQDQTKTISKRSMRFDEDLDCKLSIVYKFKLFF